MEDVVVQAVTVIKAVMHVSRIVVAMVVMEEMGAMVGMALMDPKEDKEV
jgi:hypothetical protein